MKKIAQQIRYMIKEALNFSSGEMNEVPYTKDPKTGKTVATKVFTIEGHIRSSVIKSIAGSGQSIFITDQGWFLAEPNSGITPGIGITSVVGEPIDGRKKEEIRTIKTRDGRTIGIAPTIP